MAADNTPWLVTLAVGLLGSGGLFGWWSDRQKLTAARSDATAKERQEAPANMTNANAAMAKALGDNFVKVLKGYEDSCTALTQRIAQIEERSRERAVQMEKLETRIDDLEEENERCRAENAQLLQWKGSLTRLLEAKGIDLTSAEMPDSLISFHDGQADVLFAPNRSRKR